jgi:hypothetical protein
LLYLFNLTFFGDIITFNNILFGVMSCNVSFICDHPIIWTQLNLLTNVTTTFILWFHHSWLITGFVTRLTRRVSLVEQELRTLPEHPSSPPVFSGVRVARSLVLYVCFVDRCLYFCTFSFGHCVVCSSSIYVFWLPLWYLQTLLSRLITDWSVENMKIYCVSREVSVYITKEKYTRNFWF